MTCRTVCDSLAETIYGTAFDLETYKHLRERCEVPTKVISIYDASCGDCFRTAWVCPSL